MFGDFVYHEDFSGTDSSDPTSPCGVLDIDTILSDLTFLNNPSVTAEERETNFQENSFLSQPKDQSSSKTQHDDNNRTSTNVVGIIDVYHKRRGTGGIFQRVVEDDAIRVTSKGKFLRVTIKVQTSPHDTMSNYFNDNTTMMSKTGSTWDWTRDFQFRLFCSNVNTFYNDGFSIDSRSIEFTSTALIINLEVHLWKVSRGLQFSCDIRLPNGEFIRHLTSVKFSTYSHGRGGKTNEKPSTKGNTSLSLSSTMSNTMSSYPLSFTSQNVTSVMIPPSVPNTNSLPSVHNTNYSSYNVSNASDSTQTLSDITNTNTKKRRFDSTNNNQDNDIVVPGNLVVNGSVRATAFLQYSDIRLKTNITDLTEALNIVSNLSGKRYEWKEGTLEGLQGGQKAIGLIAQEVQKVLPEAVKVTEKGYLSVEYDQLIPVLIEALKEHIRMFQENKIATQNDIQKLQSQLQEKQKTTHEITSELQEIKSKLDRLCLETQLPSHIRQKRDLIISTITSQCSHEINQEGIRIFIGLFWKQTLPEPLFELKSTCRVKTKRVFCKNDLLPARHFVCYAVRCLDEKAKYIGRYRVTGGYPSTTTFTVTKSDVKILLFDMRTNDWTNVIQPELEHILNHPSNKYMKIAYFTVTPKTIEFMTMASLVAEIQNQSRKKEHSPQVSFTSGQRSVSPPANPVSPFNIDEMSSTSEESDSDDGEGGEEIAQRSYDTKSVFQSSFSPSPQKQPSPQSQFPQQPPLLPHTQTQSQSQNSEQIPSFSLVSQHQNQPQTRTQFQSPNFTLPQSYSESQMTLQSSQHPFSSDPQSPPFQSPSQSPFQSPFYHQSSLLFHSMPQIPSHTTPLAPHSQVFFQSQSLPPTPMNTISTNVNYQINSSLYSSQYNSPQSVQFVQLQQMQSSDSQELDNMSNFPRDNAFNLFDSNKPNNNIQKEKHQPAGKRPDGKFPIFNALLHKFMIAPVLVRTGLAVATPRVKKYNAPIVVVMFTKYPDVIDSVHLGLVRRQSNEFLGIVEKVPLFRLKCLAVLLFIHSKNNDYTNEYQIFVSYRNDPQQNHHQSVFIGLDYRHGGSPKSSSYTQSALESQQHKIILRLLVDSQNIFLSSQTSQQ